MNRANTRNRALVPAAVKEYLGMITALALIVLVFSLQTEEFFTATTLRTIANQIPEYIVVAVGMTFVLVIAGIDLSVGSVLALSGAVTGVLMAQIGTPLPLAVAAGLGTGLLCGLINGLVSEAWRLPSFIVTLGMLEIARGTTHVITDSGTQYVGRSIESIATASVFGLSVPFLVAIAVVIAGQLVLTRTVFGRYMIAIGTNEEAVRLSGINPRPVKLAVFAISGGLAALGGIFQVSRFGSADPNTGTGFELQAIAAVVIGGTSLMGGRGSVIRSLFGVLIIAVLEFGLAAMGIKDERKRIITGCVIVAAVILDYYRTRMKRAAAAKAGG